MLAITTKYLASTNTRGSRFKAACKVARAPISVTVPYDYSLSGTQNHIAAAQSLLDILREMDRKEGRAVLWEGELHTGFDYRGHGQHILV